MASWLVLCAALAADWHVAYDLDGDGKVDRISDTFSGGAHCCYTLAITLSSNGKTIALPFELDGGYQRGLDLSLPDQLTIDAATHELIVRPLALPRAWRRRWHLRSHRIAIGFRRGRLRVHDRGS